VRSAGLLLLAPLVLVMVLPLLLHTVVDTALL
jgi:hypothetical protein